MKRNGKYAWGDVVNVKAIPHYKVLVDISERREDLRDFTPSLEYPMPEGNEPVPKEVRIRHVGSASLLIDAIMEKGGTEDELVAALKYYLVGINTGCDNLDIKAAYDELGIKELIKKYQNDIHKRIKEKANNEKFQSGSHYEIGQNVERKPRSERL